MQQKKINNNHTVRIVEKDINGSIEEKIEKEGVKKIKLHTLMDAMQIQQIIEDKSNGV